jgi:hypothetical protein
MNRFDARVGVSAHSKEPAISLEIGPWTISKRCSKVELSFCSNDARFDQLWHWLLSFSLCGCRVWSIVSVRVCTAKNGNFVRNRSMDHFKAVFKHRTYILQLWRVIWSTLASIISTSASRMNRFDARVGVSVHREERQFR